MSLLLFGSIFTGGIKKVLPYMIVQKQNWLQKGLKEQMNPKSCIWEPQMYATQTNVEVL